MEASTIQIRQRGVITLPAKLHQEKKCTSA